MSPNTLKILDRLLKETSAETKEELDDETIQEMLTASKEPEWKEVFWCDVVEGNFCFYAKPLFVKFVTLSNGNEVLHCLDGPCSEYPSGVKYWFMWGVEILPVWATTPADDLDIAEAMSLKNVEQRQVVMRKIGIQRLRDKLPSETVDTGFITRKFQTIKLANGEELSAKLGLTVEKLSIVGGVRAESSEIHTRKDKYTLYEFNFGTKQTPVFRRYLHMINPSEPEDIIYERVDLKCSTIREALSFRDLGEIVSNYEPSEMLT